MNNLKSIDVIYKEQTVGTLSVFQGNLTAFQYSPQWIRDGFSISPFTLPLENKVFFSKSEPFNGIFGVFADSLPDGWGALTLDRFLKSKGIIPGQVNIITRLALLDDNSSGALEYKPKLFDKSESFGSFDFDQLFFECTEILRSETHVANLDKIYSLAGSSGGARPKINALIDGDLWIVKYPALYDSSDIGIQEYNYNKAAERCGITVSETKLIPSTKSEGFFATKRFDRDKKGQRIHKVSVAGLLEADYTIPCLDYTSLMKLVSVLTNSEEQLKEMYRRMCFNVIFHNRDDHAKNFSFLFDDRNKTWTLSPAYDLTYSNSYNGWHATSVDNNGENPTQTNMLNVGINSGLEQKWCLSVIENTKRESSSP